MTRKKRSDNEGTVYWSEARKKWVAQLPADPLTKKRVLRTADTEREAIALLKILQRERDKGKDVGAKQPTVAGFLNTWLDEVCAPTLKPATTPKYRSMLNRYAVSIAELRVDEVTPALAQRWANALAKQVAPATVWHVYRRLRSAFDVAVEWRYITSNPFTHIRLPKLPRTAARVYSVPEVRRLLAAVETWRLMPLVWAMVVLGLRRGEVLGLAWRDLDWDARTITIRQQVQEIDSKVVISPTTKNDQIRTLPVPTVLLALLRTHWTLQQQERNLLKTDWKEHGLIFPCENGKPLRPGNFNRALSNQMKKAGVAHARVHDQRHTCATLLAELDISERTIGAILGHTPKNITQNYTKVRLESMRKALQQLEDVLTAKAEVVREVV